MAKYALLIIDMQRAYFHNQSLADVQKDLVIKGNMLIELCAKSGIPIINIVTEQERDKSTWTLNMLADKQGYLFSGDEETKVVEGLVIPKSEHIIKIRDSAFFKTDLDLILHSLGVNTVILMGVSTHSCIMLTAADAYAHNFKVILATDAIATHDPKYHRSTLQMLEKEYRQDLYSNEKISFLLKELHEMS